MNTRDDQEQLPRQLLPKCTFSVGIVAMARPGSDTRLNQRCRFVSTQYEDLRLLYIRGIVTGYYSMLVLGVAGSLCYAFVETTYKGRTQTKVPGAVKDAFITALYLAPVAIVLVLSINGFFAIPSFSTNHDQAAQICAKPLQSEVPR